MRIINAPKASGKTNALLDMLLKDSRRVLIVHTNQRAHDLQEDLVKKHKFMRRDAERRIIPTSRALKAENLRMYPHDTEFIIDELSLVLNAIFGNVTVATMTGEVEDWSHG